MEHKTFERTTPDGYKEVYHIDAADKKTGILFTLGSLVIAATIIFIVFRSIRHFSFSFTADFLRYEIVLLISLLAYIILHELTHGAVYKMLTHEKLKFGVTWSAAFCGVPDIYTYRSTALKSLIAPLMLFSVILIPLTIWLYNVNLGWYIVSGILLAMHLSGCIGDIYVTLLFLIKFRDPSTLMRDTGPEQWIYIKEE